MSTPYLKAHEIGHERLQAFAGTVYSWQHKGSSYFFPQDEKPVNPKDKPLFCLDYLPNTNGETYPKSGEIDLMKYYNDDDFRYDYNRIVVAENEIIGLLWLLKCIII